MNQNEIEFTGTETYKVNADGIIAYLKHYANSWGYKETLSRVEDIFPISTEQHEVMKQIALHIWSQTN